MSNTSPGYREPPFPMVSLRTGTVPACPTWTATTDPSSGTWPDANRAFFYPFYVPSITVIRRIWWANGSTVLATYNVDVGIYTSAANLPTTRLISSGSTAQGTASQVQFVDVTDTTLTPGLYWLAMTCSSASATFFRNSPSATGLRRLSSFTQATALPLPATATPALNDTYSYIPLCGFATTASP